jgi:alkylation response protein AidB-like acyl-CoA dehydrogenase
LRLATIDGEIARDEAIDRVLDATSPAWKRAVHALICDDLPFGWEGIFEQIRFMAEARGLWAHTPEAWGGIAQTALRNKTLRYKSPIVEERMAGSRSHARASKVMVRTEWF